MKLKKWIKKNQLNVEFIEGFADRVFIIDDKSFLVVKHKEGKVFDENFQLILDDLEMSMIEKLDYFTFCFGGKWYYFHKDSDPELTPLKYIGKVKTEL